MANKKKKIGVMYSTNSNYEYEYLSNPKYYKRGGATCTSRAPTPSSSSRRALVAIFGNRNGEGGSAEEGGGAGAGEDHPGERQQQRLEQHEHQGTAHPDEA